MKEREKIINFFSSSGDEAKEMAIRLVDLAESVERGRPFTVSSFMSPLSIQIGQTIAAHMKTVTSSYNGGYHEAERVKVAFQSNDYGGKVNYEISLLSVKWDDRFRLIGHRDVLGSLMGLGIEREVLGDILMQGAQAQILVDGKMSEYIKSNFTKVAMVPVQVEEIPLEELKVPEQKAKEIRAMVASMRLDAVGAAGFGLSRTKMVQMIDGDRVQVNWQSAKSVSQTVKVKDIISIRGKGRIEIEEITGKSRKGRTGLLINRFK